MRAISAPSNGRRIIIKELLDEEDVINLTSTSSTNRPKSSSSQSRSPPLLSPIGKSLLPSPTSSPSNENHTALTHVMVDAKLNRKKAETDLQALASRISLLRTEEHKAIMKVSETKARAKEILNQKKRKEDTIQSELSKTIGRDLRVKAAQERAAIERENRQRKLTYSKKISYDCKRAVAEEQKEIANKLAEQVLYTRLHLDEEKRLKAEEEKRRKEKVRLQRLKAEAEKERKAHLQYTLKIAEEAKRRKEAEDLIDVLEKEERELIARLKSAQELQQKAYSLLAKSLEA